MSDFGLIPVKDYKAICDAIRAKDKSSGLIKSGEAANKILNISTLKDDTPGTASSGEVLYGETAWVNGNKITGTMPNNGAISGSLQAGGSKTIPAGYTTGGTITANSLSSQTSGTASAGEILKTKTAWVNGNKITGTMPNNGAISGSLQAGGSKTIPAGYTTGGTITANSLSSQTSGTANSIDILSGKTAWVNGSQIIGNMPNNGSKTASLNAGQSYTIPKGYHNGSGKITANSLSSQTSGTASAGEILKTKTAWVNGNKITGTMPNNGAINASLSAGGSKTIPAGYTTGGTITANSLSSQTSGTASAGEILYGETAWVNGKQITGTMTNNGTKTYSLNAGQSYTIPKGYHNGSGNITANSLRSQTSGTADPVNILSGETAWVNGRKITGTMPNNDNEEILLDAEQKYEIPEGYHDGTGIIRCNSLSSQTPGTASAGEVLYGETAWVNGEQIIGTIKDGDLMNFDGYTHATGRPIDKKYMDNLSAVIDTIIVSDLPASEYATTRLNDDGTVLCEMYGRGVIIYSKDGEGVFAPVISESLFESYNANIIDLSNFDTSNVTDMRSMFNGSSSLKSLDVNNFDTSKVTDMSYMFGNCYYLVSLDLSSFNTSNVINMRSMFNGSSSLKSLDLSSFNTSRVTDMANMFTGCSSLKSLDVSSFNTSNVTDMSYMFNGCSSTTLDLSSFNTSNVIDMSGMFDGCYSLTSLDLSSFNTSKVINMSNMFNNCKFTTLDISNFDTSKVIYMLTMFSNCNSLTELDLSSFNTSRVTDMDNMFGNCNNIKTLDLSSFDTSSVDKMNNMFNGCSSLTSLDLSSFNTSKVYSMNNMFSYCSSLTKLDLSSFDTSRVDSMTDMFYGCTSLKIVYCHSQSDMNNFKETNPPSNISFIVKRS